MIKYVELTAPEASAYRQAKILSIEFNEGDYVKAGDALFMVQSGNTKLELPATKEGRIVEFIVSEQENITLSTPLLLLETEVESSTATPPLEQIIEAPAPKQAMPIDDKQMTAHHEQQSLDLLAGLNESTKEPEEAATAPDLDEELEHATHRDTTEINSMSEIKLLSVNVPDIGADSAKVIEILVNIGDEITVEDALLTLESDKASMDVPSPYSGVVKTILVAIDQDVSEGIALIELEVTDGNNDTASLASTAATETRSKSAGQATEPTEPSAPPAPELAEETSNAESEQVVSIAIPDIGGDSAKVVDVLVSVGDEVAVEDALLTLESDKASMDVPSTTAGVIQSIEVSIDDDVSEGTVVATIVAKVATNVTASGAETSNVSEPSPTAAKQEPPLTSAPAASIAPAPATSIVSTAQNSSNTPNSGPSHASPSIRRFARELGVDLAKVSGTGRKSRIIKDDVKNFVKASLAKPAGAATNVASGSGAGIPAVPAQDFSKFGDIEVTPLNKIKRLTANNLHRSWLNVPHVTHNDESNINDLESFRKQLNAEYKAQDRGIKLSPLAFIVKAVVNALQSYPQFNSSLEPGGENLILKKYFHIGIAVETPNGLVVPVIRDADTKSVTQIAKEMGELAAKARDKKLTMNDMSGACFTISSLGGIGGTSFTPIVNAPEVAILGVSRSKIQPVWNGEEFIPGMMLPLSLSYDHRVIDGAEAARFTRHIAAVLEDVRRLTV